MKITISVVLFSFLIVGCADGKFHRESIANGPCGLSIDGYTYTMVRYGDGKISIKPRSNIRANSEWRFYLKPIDKLGGPAYRDSTVTVEGKSPGDLVLDPATNTLVPYVMPGPPPPNDNWLSASGTFNTGASGPRRQPYISTCVPADVKELQEWYYTVTIENVGSVDPRGRVED